MAKVEIKMPEEFLQKVSKLQSSTDDIVSRALEDGGKVVLGKVKSNLSGVVGRGTKYPARSKGDLEAALGMSPVKADRKGDHNIKIGFSEPHPGGTSNAKLANILEYGKHGQPAKPFLKPARSSSRRACIDAMQARLEEEIEKL